jgi:hypothetical protein
MTFPELYPYPQTVSAEIAMKVINATVHLVSIAAINVTPAKV